MKPTVSLNPRDALSLQHTLTLLALPARKRVWILKTLGRWEKANVRARIRQQKDVNGKALAPRQQGRKKMFRRLAKGLEPYVKNGGKTLDLTWRNTQTARTAARHHLGQTQRMSAYQLKRRWGTPDYDAPPSKSMAKALREKGFTIRTARGKGRKKPTLSWIQKHLTHGKAGAILRELSGKPTQSQWDIPLAKRPLLGSSSKNVNRQLVTLIKQAQQRTH
ncbi:virion morphogenesis protein [Enterovibrio norvegicus]|uniref:virion morphogenesis protein n=1 Tax=Enterovibrio norvegicus TaxID=188144 RepID=UPI000C82F635|nr:virion morphogenesis protein [Enterovibrio norvegicus]PMH59609.1 virion morphogenesis protein [Enterovibrio norvegicus]